MPESFNELTSLSLIISPLELRKAKSPVLAVAKVLFINVLILFYKLLSERTIAIIQIIADKIIILFSFFINRHFLCK